MQFSAAQIAMMANGRVEGDASVMVESFGKIEEATPSQLTFLANPKYEEYLYLTKASVIIVNEAQELRQDINATLIRVPDAYSAFATLLDKYQQIQTQQLTGTEQPSFIHPTAKIGDGVYIGAFAYIAENAIVANGAKIFPGAYIGRSTTVGENSIIHPGVKIYHEGVVGKNVVIEDNVEIGANTAIDRGTIGSTLIKAGAKLDNLLQIAHNVEVGNNSVIAAQAGISGSTKVGNNVMIGGQVGIVGHLQIADGSKINAQSGVSKSIKKPNSAVTGSPAYDYTAALRSQALARQLPDLEKRIKELEEAFKEIQERSS